MKKTAVLILIILAVSFPLSAGEHQIKKDKHIDDKIIMVAKERSQYHAYLESLGYKKSEIGIIAKKGYSPYLMYLYLRIAEKSKSPVSRIINLRSHGYSTADICRKVKLDYYKFMDETDSEVIEKNIEFPAATGDEHSVDAATMPKTEVQE
ncbi:MAG: hypothetical protein JXR81_06555 [Candidatus Goldbacteria bacterium]|nr:hypothetical protein [Candidatus Goldiibacteriota bacterium]